MKLFVVASRQRARNIIAPMCACIKSNLNLLANVVRICPSISHPNIAIPFFKLIANNLEKRSNCSRYAFEIEVNYFSIQTFLFRSLPILFFPRFLETS